MNDQGMDMIGTKNGTVVHKWACQGERFAIEWKRMMVGRCRKPSSNDSPTQIKVFIHVFVRLREKMMSITMVDRFHPKRRDAWQAAADEGRLRQVDELALLDPEQILPLTRFSLLLFVLGSVFFIVLNLFAYVWRTGKHGASINGGQILLWILISLVSYTVILIVHELLHGVAFVFWGGKPYYGAKLPIALYCGAKDQVFPRNYYLVVGLAPFVVITLFGIIFTLFAPTLSPYLLFAFIGNVAGAAGDLWVIRRLLAQPASVFVEDLETGYRVWQVTASAGDATIAFVPEQDEKL